MPRSVPGPVRDPHCGRSIDDRIEFAVNDEVWDVQWGRYEVFGTPAFWVDQTVRECYSDKVAEMASRTGIESEIVFCLLGGFGVTAELAHAAYQAVLELLDVEPAPGAETIEERLRQPLPGGWGHYRFPKQRAERISNALRQIRAQPPPNDPIELRPYLIQLHGVGPKTAAWIVRNVTGCADVAIIDIWLIRALTWIGIFKPEWRVEKHYERFEDVFLQFASHGNVQPGALDLCIWEYSRVLGPKYYGK